MMQTFEEILPGTFILRVPFGPVWTGVILIRGEKTVMIDSSHETPDLHLLPALDALGVKPGDVDWLLNTHVHGDHIGGHHALVTEFGLKTATLDAAADALRDPVSVAIRVRTKFPMHSPPPQCYLKGVEPDRLLREGEPLEGRFSVYATPGHDDDCLCWLDSSTHTLFTGDSLQANGTPSQGIGFYRDLAAYRATLGKLAKMTAAGMIENIVCGHFYDGIGDVICGRTAVEKALAYCEDRVKAYGEWLAGRSAADEEALAELSLRLIDEMGCGRPQSLFLAMHTVEQHLKREG